MLETRHSSKQTIKPSLAFVPRQVSLLAKRTNMKKNEKAASETLEETELIKDEALNMRSSKKEKKEKKEKKKSKKSKKESSNDLSPLLLSIAAFLKRHGFSKTLAALQCEASIEELDGSKVHKIDLETYYKYLGTSEYDGQYDGKADLNDSEELDFHKDGIAKEKDKKKKKSKSLDAENVDQDSTELLVEKNKENTKHSVSSQGECKDSSIVPLEETNMKSRDSEKKKNKVKSDKDIEGCNSENGIGDIHAEGKHVKSKDKKRKNKLSTESSGGGEDMGKNNFEKESVPTMEETAVSLARTSSKKRKKLASENDELETNGKIRSKEMKQGKIEGSQEEKENANANAHSLPESEYAAGKRRKTEKRDVVSIKCKEITPGKQLDGLTNGNILNNGTVESGTKSGTTKQQKGSAEPKTVNAFQRVKVDGVEFADERLQDNSYWAKDGAETGYGAKAQEVLGQVKGRDFRHEKTKKKRGSYRGGQIDLQTHSIKFQYSDEE